MRSDKKENVNRNLIIDSDKTIYLYYTDDKEYRSKLVDGLNDSLLKADRIDESKYNASDVAALKAKASEAREILNRAAPNKAFSPELAKVLEELNALLNKLGISTKPTPNKPDNNNKGGGSGGGGGGRGSSRSTGGSKTENTVKVGTDGSWQLLNPEEKDLSKSQWVFNLTSGKRLTAWAYLSYTYDGHTKLAWYHFDSNGIMDSGWFCDTDGRWYYLSTNHDGFFGEMMTGWHLDMDGRWYYLNPNGGAMMTGWAKVGNDYYYLSPSSGANRPYGSMYHNEQTPDGYTVNAHGAWK